MAYLYAQKSKIWLYFVLPVLVASILFTLSRSGLLAIVLLITTIPLVFRNNRRQFLMSILKLSITILILAFMVNSFVSPGLVEELTNLIVLRTSDLDYASSPRGQLVQVGLDIWLKSPLFGVGLGAPAVLMGLRHNQWNGS